MTQKNKLLRVITHLLKYDKEMPFTRIQVLLLVAKDTTGKGVLVRDLRKHTGLNQTTIARALALLGDKTSRGQKHPLQWVAMRPDPDDPRRVLCSLTPKGETALAEIEQLLE